MNNDIIILAEQHGEIERQFKKQITDVFINSGVHLRAYLALVQYGSDPEKHITLLMKSATGEDQSLSNSCGRVFHNMFAQTQHLDIVFISDEQEQDVRKVCCPFYTSPDFNVTIPDFYLYSDEGYQLDDVIRNCYMRARLHADRLDDYILCDTDPPVNNMNQLIIASKFQGTSLFPVSEWPLEIYVLKPLIENIAFQDIADSTNSELIAWATLYNRKEDIRMIEP